MDIKPTRHIPGQIICKLRKVNRLLAENILASRVMRHLQISHLTYQRWRIQYGAFRADDGARLKTLEQENAKLKRMQRLWQSEGLYVQRHKDITNQRLLAS